MIFRDKKKIYVVNPEMVAIRMMDLANEHFEYYSGEEKDEKIREKRSIVHKAFFALKELGHVKESDYRTIEPENAYKEEE